MYTSNPLEGNAYGGIPPAKPSPEWKELQMARQRVGLMLVAHAKTQPQALLPHLAALANKIQEMWAAGVIGTNEQSTLFDVILAAAAGADIQLQKQARPLHHLQRPFRISCINTASVSDQLCACLGIRCCASVMLWGEKRCVDKQPGM